MVADSARLVAGAIERGWTVEPSPDIVSAQRRSQTMSMRPSTEALANVARWEDEDALSP